MRTKRRNGRYRYLAMIHIVYVSKIIFRELKSAYHTLLIGTPI